MIGHTDKPVNNINDDLFSIEAYINALCSFIRSCETPMTISIQGDWGSGKTSMMNMMKANLQGSAWPIWFNTWQFSQFNMGNMLVFSMMDAILKSLDCTPDTRERIINGLVGFSKRIIKNVSDYTLGGEITNLISSTLDSQHGNIDYASDITELMNKFETAVDSKLEKEHRDRVVIFVDDLDRLQPSKAVELLEVLKLFLNCHKCVFILAVDYEVVATGIRQKLGDDIALEKGKNFFDKIIQLPFKMPVASYDIRKYIKKMVNNIDDAEVNLYYNLIRTSIGFNPRSIKRLFNTFELLDIVTKSTAKKIDDNIRRKILFSTVCIQMCFEQLYAYLTSNRIDDVFFASMLDECSRDITLREIYGLLPDDENEQLIKLKAFIPYFIESLQEDDDLSVSDNELSNFNVILGCSVVTSVNAMHDIESIDSISRSFREQNKVIAKDASKMLSDIAPFSIWLPRKSRQGVKFSDASGWSTFHTDLGFDYTLEYYISRESEIVINISIQLTISQGKGLENIFFDVFGENPLKLASPNKYTWGRYTYANILRVNAEDSTIANQIASITRNAYNQIIICLDSYRNTYNGAC